MTVDLLRVASLRVPCVVLQTGPVRILHCGLALARQCGATLIKVLSIKRLADEALEKNSKYEELITKKELEIG